MFSLVQNNFLTTLDYNSLHLVHVRVYVDWSQLIWPINHALLHLSSLVLWHEMSLLRTFQRLVINHLPIGRVTSGFGRPWNLNLFTFRISNTYFNFFFTKNRIFLRIFLQKVLTANGHPKHVFISFRQGRTASLIQFKAPLGFLHKPVFHLRRQFLIGS